MLKCRKCNGPHLTIKCGKELVVSNNNKSSSSSNNNNNNSSSSSSNNNNNNNNNNNRYKNKITVKMSNLPDDMTYEELLELTYDWGDIINIKVLKYSEVSVAYIDFAKSEEANYFIKALDKTPFEYMILNVKIV
jgi:RNA recognition motif-containing protein